MARLKPTQLEKVIKNINDKTMYDLELNNLKPYYALVNNEDIFCDILVRIANNPHIDAYVFMQRLDFALNNLYTKVVTDQSNLSDFYNLLNIYLENPELITKESLENLSNAFDEKKLIYETYLYLSRPERFGDLNGVKLNNIDLITRYLVKARELYVDDRALYTSFINLITNNLGIDVLKYGNPEQLEEAINSKLIEDRKANGVYDIDEATIKEFDRKIESMGLLNSRLNTLLDIAENEEKNLAASIKDTQEEITRKRVEELRILDDEARKITSNFNTDYLDLLQQQKKRVYDDRDALIAEINEFIERKKQEITLLSDKVTNDIAAEIVRIKRASSDSIGTIKDYVSNDESISKLIQEASNNKALFEKIAFVEDLASKFDDRPIIQEAPESETKGKRKGKTAVQSSEKIILPSQTIVVPTSTIEEPIDYTVNYYFDKSKKYKERIKRALEIKHKMADEGEIFHEKFDDLLTMVIKNSFPYLYGPSGCGKTYMIEEQLTKILNMSIITNSHILYEQDIIGFNNAGNGGFVKTNFYRAYRAGKLLFYDELDKSNPDSTIILNAFLKKRDNTTYAFPNGEVVSRHPNFRIVTAGNTKGSGKTTAYNTGKKMDESIKQRLMPIEIGYDNRIEERILKDYPGWFEFAVLFRESLEKTKVNGSGDELNSIGTFTTRDAEEIRDYKDDGAFSDEKLMEYQIIEDKDIDYLEQIRKKMQSGTLKTEEGKKLLKIFNTQVDIKKQNAK